MHHWTVFGVMDRQWGANRENGRRNKVIISFLHNYLKNDTLIYQNQKCPPPPSRHITTHSNPYMALSTSLLT